MLSKQLFLIVMTAFAAVIPYARSLSAQQLDSIGGTEPRAESPQNAGFLPTIVFRPLIADPAEPQLGTSIRQGDFPERGSLDGIAAFGASIPIIGFSSARTTVQIGTAGGFIARFDMHSRANDLVSEDYQLGFPVWINSGAFESRIRVYHRSSHVGDEFALNHPAFTRFDMTYEAIEGIFAVSARELRAYVGGDYIYHNVTTPIDAGSIHAGGDVVSSKPFYLRTLRGRMMAGLDLQAARDLKWRVAKSGVAGVELSRAESRTPSMRILMEFFSGPSTAGQFYGRTERYVGLAAYITP